MLLNLLESNVDGSGNSGSLFVMIAVFVVVIGGFMVYNYFRGKKQVKEAEEKLRAIAVGDTVLTIGMISGEIVEVIDDGAYFVIKTGNAENFGFLKIDARAIYQTFKPEDLLKAQQDAQQAENQAEALPTELPEELTQEEASQEIAQEEASQEEIAEENKAEEVAQENQAEEEKKDE